MKRIDWQAYRDGSLSVEEAELAERQLLSDPAARRELEGLSQFVGAVRSSAKSVDVPLSRLEKLIPSPKVTQRTHSGVWITLAAAAVIAIAFLLRPKDQNTPTDEFGFKTTDPVAAAQWLQPKFAFHVPALNLGADAPLEFVHRGGNSSCCLDYAYRGNVYHVNFLKKGTDRVRNGRPIKLASGLNAVEGRGVSWSQGEWDLHIVGPVDADRIELASRTSRELESGL